MSDLRLSDADEVLLESLVLSAADNVAKAESSKRADHAPTRRRAYVETDTDNVYLGTGSQWVDVSENTGLLSSLFDGGDGNFESVNTDDQTINNSLAYGTHDIAAILEATDSGQRVETGVIDHSDTGNAADDSWSSNAIDDQNVTFSTAFSSDPVILTQIQAGAGGYQPVLFSISTTGFTSRLVYYESSGSIASPNVTWIAIGAE